MTRPDSTLPETVYVSTTRDRGTSQNNNDYEGIEDRAYTFGAGDPTITVNVRIDDDDSSEPIETFGLVVQAIASPNLDPEAANNLVSASFNIIDDDTSSGSATFTEGDDDEFLALIGASTLDGLSGEDTVMLDLRTRDEIRTSLSGSARIFSDSNNSVRLQNLESIHVIGGSESDRIQTGAGNDVLLGGAGNDTLDGGSGFDALVGGSGDDTLLNVGERDVVDGGSGRDLLRFDANGSTNDLTLNLGTGDGLGGSWTGIERVTGFLGAGYDTVVAGAQFEDLWGGDGEDLLVLDYANGFAGSTDVITRFSLDLNSDSTSGGGNEFISYTDSAGGNAQTYRTYMNQFERFDIIGSDGNDFVQTKGGADRIIGGDGDDTTNAGAGADTINAGAGNDLLRGGEGDDLAIFNIASSSITTEVSSGRLYVTSTEGRDELGSDVERIQFFDRTLTFDQLFTLIPGTDDSQTIQGTAAGEQINGLGGFDWIVPDRGDDVVDGGADRDMVSYSDIATDVPGRGGAFMVDLDLGGGTVNVFGGEVDQLISIERATGSIFADVLRGTDGNDELRGIGDYDWFVATPGQDTLNGGNGLDMVTFLEAQSSSAPVVQDIFATDGVPPTGAAVGGVLLDLADGSNNTGLAEGLTLISVERVTGSSHQDVFFGDGEQNDFRGLGGFDWFVSSTGGRERYFGGDGVDTVTYFNAGSGVTASLRNGAGEFGGQETGYGSTGDAIRDLYFEIENLVGSDFDDRLEGNRERNDLVGRDGDDYLLGYGNIDYLKGGLGNDTLDGGAGSDFALFDGNRSDYTLTRTSRTEVTVSGPDGTDSLINVEYFQFDDQTANIWELSIF